MSSRHDKYNKHMLLAVRNALLLGAHDEANSYESRHPGIIAEAQKGLSALQETSTNETVVSKGVRQEGGVIYFSVVNNSTTDEDWVTRLESKGFHFDYSSKEVLCSPDFKPSKPGTVIEVAVLPRTLFKKDEELYTEHIRLYALNFRTPDNRALVKPNAVLACLIREKFTDEEIEAMGLWGIVAMHEPINADGDLFLLGAYRGGGRSLSAFYGSPDTSWSRRGYGLAFEVSSF